MKVYLVLAFLLCYTTVGAQNVQEHIFYLNGGVGAGNYLGGRLGLNYIYKEKLYAHIGQSTYIRLPQNTPPDHNPGFFGLFFLMTTFDVIESYDVMVGKIKPLNDKGTVRLNLRGGLSYVKFEEVTNWKRQSPDHLMGNYTYEIKHTNTVGLVLEPTIEFPVSRVVGLSLSAYMHMNTETVAVGISANALVGLLRRRLSTQPQIPRS